MAYFQGHIQRLPHNTTNFCYCITDMKKAAMTVCGISMGYSILFSVWEYFNKYCDLFKSTGGGKFATYVLYAYELLIFCVLIGSIILLVTLMRGKPLVKVYILEVCILMTLSTCHCVTDMATYFGMAEPTRCYRSLDDSNDPSAIYYTLAQTFVECVFGVWFSIVVNSYAAQTATAE